MKILRNSSGPMPEMTRGKCLRSKVFYMPSSTEGEGYTGTLLVAIRKDERVTLSRAPKPKEIRGNCLQLGTSIRTSPDKMRGAVLAIGSPSVSTRGVDWHTLC